MTSETLSKVPAVTLGFWIIEILATTLGEIGGDTLSMTWELGYLARPASSSCCWAFWLPRRFARMVSHPQLYWATIIASDDGGHHDRGFCHAIPRLGHAGGTALLLRVRCEPARSYVAQGMGKRGGRQRGQPARGDVLPRCHHPVVDFAEPRSVTRASGRWWPRLPRRRALTLRWSTGTDRAVVLDHAHQSGAAVLGGVHPRPGRWVRMWVAFLDKPIRRGWLEPSAGRWHPTGAVRGDCRAGAACCRNAPRRVSERLGFQRTSCTSLDIACSQVLQPEGMPETGPVKNGLSIRRIWPFSILKSFGQLPGPVDAMVVEEAECEHDAAFAIHGHEAAVTYARSTMPFRPSSNCFLQVVRVAAAAPARPRAFSKRTQSSVNG